ncbi:uncharacterized protein LOC143040455 [Oratosquilla oratoria]|uniref:uncharacterized protein LOC143040455 n=1 Tax=Oratosquilla oratoria TaxID=337810 RepID=UPI003F759D95
MFRQIDGVAMSSPLGVLFANFFMGRIERDVFSIQQKPRVYARYIDDIFVLAKDDDEIRHLHNFLQEASGLNLSVENSSDGCLPFLDILVNQKPHGFDTKIFCMLTNPGLPQRTEHNQDMNHMSHLKYANLETAQLCTGVDRSWENWERNKRRLSQCSI